MDSSVERLSQEALRLRPQLAATAAELWRSACEPSGESAFLPLALAGLAKSQGADAAAVLSGTAGGWRAVGSYGSAAAWPYEAAAEALDRESAVRKNPWLVVPLGTSAAEAWALAFSSPVAMQQAEGAVTALAPLFAAALAVVRRRQREAQRLQRLEALVQIASHWNATQEMEPLLVQMAEAATRLLASDRASIFLWDRKTRTLVGRPALGVAGNELRIPENTGVVGQVVRTGEPARVSQAEQKAIDRQVDQQTGYRTRNLLCVPLRGRGGELFGAFEVLNRVQGDYTSDDEAALIELAAHAAVALENTQERQQLFESRRQISEQAAQRVQLIGESPALATLREKVQRVAGTDLPVLVLGENGTGKEVVSQMIHYLSPRRDQPIVAVNCAALSETLLESELFGHEKGAFTDAHAMRQGKFEVASGGTIFLDEIGDLSLAGQAKLLRVLEQKEVVRVGGSTPIHTDARVVAATNQDLATMVRERRFRQDLFFRLNVVALETPPLRARGNDVLILARHFLQDFCKRARRKPLEITDAAAKRLLAHPWPGNVRELRNLMERLAYLSTSDRIEADELAFALAPMGEVPSVVAPDQTLAAATDAFQTDYIQKSITRADGNMSDAARILGLHRSNLYRKMRQLGMNPPDK